MKRRHWILAGVGLVLVVLAVWQLGAAAGGLEVTTVRDAEPRLVVMAPEGVAPGSRPLVLIAHGFSGSTAIMRGFALTLAHAGYTAVLWDFEGHGTNPEPMSSSSGGGSLTATAEAALAEALARGYGDPERVAILGHSMGSGVALAFGIDHPGTAATIAVSPTGQECDARTAAQPAADGGRAGGTLCAERRAAPGGGRRPGRRSRRGHGAQDDRRAGRGAYQHPLLTNGPRRGPRLAGCNLWSAAGGAGLYGPQDIVVRAGRRGRAAAGGRAGTAGRRSQSRQC